MAEVSAEHKDGEHRLTARGAAASAGGHLWGSGRRGREKPGEEALGRGSRSVGAPSAS